MASSSSSSQSQIKTRKRSSINQVIQPVITSNDSCCTTAPSIRRVHSANDSSDETWINGNKNKKAKRKTKPVTPVPTLHHTPAVIPKSPTSAPASSDQPDPNNSLSTSYSSNISPQVVLPQQVQAQTTSQPFITPVITKESARYAQTRFPFPPFVIKFSNGNVTANQVKSSVITHCKNSYNQDINVLNCRMATKNASANNNTNIKSGYDMLLYLKDVVSFAFLLEENHWPNLFNNVPFSIPFLPSIPPQLSLLIKNVDLKMNFDEFTNDIKLRHSEVKNVIRLKNKFQNEIKLVKIELSSPELREQLLNDKKITVDYITYDIDEYLAPANVLICSKCMAIGHFRRQCTQVKETCYTCGELVDNKASHQCSNVEKCIRCGNNHKSNSLKCPVVKSFRAELTRKLLSIDPPITPHAWNTTPATNYGNHDYQFISSNFPPLPQPQVPPWLTNNNFMASKLDELLEKMSDVNNHLAKLSSNNVTFEQFMNDKKENDALVKDQLNSFNTLSSELGKNVSLQGTIIERHDNILLKLVTPMLEDLFGLFNSLNLDKNGRILDADLKCKFERYRVQLKKVRDVKSSSFI